MPNLHENHRSRLRGRFISDCTALGGDALRGWEEHNIAELLLFYAIPRRDVNDDAHLLCERFGSLEGALMADRGALTPSVARLFAAITALAPYAAGSDEGFADANTAVRGILGNMSDGEVKAVFLTASLIPLGEAELCPGAADAVMRSSLTREIIQSGAECVMTVRKNSGVICGEELSALRVPYEIARCLGLRWLGAFASSSDTSPVEPENGGDKLKCAAEERALLASLLANVSPSGADELSVRLLGRFHSLRAVLRADIRVLCAEVGERAAVLAALPRALTRHISQGPYQRGGRVGRAQALRAAGEHFVKLYAGADGELCRLCALPDGRMPRDFDICGGGSFSSARLDINALARYALSHPDCDIIAAHNHPPSERELSRRDIETAELVRCNMRTMGLNLAACMMICGSGYTLF